MTLRFAPFAFALGFAICSSSAAIAAEVHYSPANPVVELNVMEEVSSEPDMALIGTGVTNRAPTAKAALAANSAAMRGVIDRIKASGVAARDIQTSGLNLQAQYDYGQNRPARFIGYEVTNRVSVKVRDLTKLGEMLDAFVAAGATNLDGPSFTIDDDRAVKAEARRRAFERGQEQALSYARAAGYTGVRLLSVGETVASRQPMPMADMRVMPVSVQAAPIEIGEVSSMVTLDLTYEMTR